MFRTSWVVGMPTSNEPPDRFAGPGPEAAGSRDRRSAATTRNPSRDAARTSRFRFTDASRTRDREELFLRVPAKKPANRTTRDPRRRTGRDPDAVEYRRRSRHAPRTPDTRRSHRHRASAPSTLRTRRVPVPTGEPLPGPDAGRAAWRGSDRLLPERPSWFPAEPGFGRDRRIHRLRERPGDGRASQRPRAREDPPPSF